MPKDTTTPGNGFYCLFAYILRYNLLKNTVITNP